MKCKKHPRYKGILKPRTDCWRCWLVYYVHRVRKFLGLQVPTARRRAVSKKMAEQIQRDCQNVAACGKISYERKDDVTLITGQGPKVQIDPRPGGVAMILGKGDKQ